MASQSYLMSLAYDGRDFHGYQYQEELRTVQGDLEDLLSYIFKEKIRIQASGRTDAGVHALDQRVSFEAPKIMELDRLAYVIKRFLPRDIQLNNLKVDNLHPRYDALAKSYIYRISYEDNLFLRPYSLYLKKELDLEALRYAARHLEGSHDFYNFSNRRKKEESTIRTIYKIKILESPKGLDLVFIGDGFLYRMVRIMVAYLNNVGLGKYQPSATKKILLKRDRKETRQVAPAEGLFLAEVFYSQEELADYLDLEDKEIRAKYKGKFGFSS